MNARPECGHEEERVEGEMGGVTVTGHLLYIYTRPFVRHLYHITLVAENLHCTQASFSMLLRTGTVTMISKVIPFHVS